LLSQTGRTFAYIPQPAPPVGSKPAVKPAPVAAQTPSMRDEGLRGVSWKSPESWQARRVSGTAGQWRSADAIADITRQLSGAADAAPPSRAPAIPTASGSWTATMRADVPAANRSSEALAVGAAMERLDESIASARHPQAPDDHRPPLSMSLAPRGTQIAGPHGYLIYVVAEQVPNGMYRGRAEIMKDGRRVERSGLVGPRFADAHAAGQYALEWARQWIDRECLTQAAGECVDDSTRVPSACASTEAVRPLPALRQVPEPVAANHGAPLHGPLNALRGPLRRYPGDALAATGSSPDNSSAPDRCASSYTQVISHAR
jgi:hypothetical protein